MSGPRKTNKTPAEGAAPGTPATPSAATPPPSAPPPAAAAPTPAPEASVPPPQPATAPPPAAPAAPAAPAGPPPGAQVAAAITGLASGIKEKLSTAELMLGTGALLIFGLSFLILGFLLDSRSPTESAVIVSALLLVLIGLERTEREGFGTWYRVLLILLGAILALGAAYNLLLTLRGGTGGFSVTSWLSMLSWWIGGLLAAIGAWMTYRVRA